MSRSSPSSFQPPLSIDITWNCDSSNRPPPSVRIYLRPLYDLLRRRVPPEGSHESSYDFALHPGVGIPTLFGRPLHVIEEEARTLASTSAMRVAVVFLDKSVELGAEAFRESFNKLIELADPAASPLLLIPVIVEPGWHRGPSQLRVLDVTSEKESDRQRVVSESVAIELSRWLMGRKDKLPAAVNRRVCVFVSRSKHRHGKTGITAETITQMLRKERRLKEFFEVTAIESEREIANSLRKEENRAILLCVRTDSYAESSWCQRELLLAKELQIPIVMVTQLEDRERRAPAYAGNMVNIVAQRGVNRRALLEDLLRVWLHNLYFPIHAMAIADLVGLPVKPRIVVRHPELVDFALNALPGDVSSVVLYPDPPLPTVETQVLRQGYPRVRLTTPTTLFGNVLRNDDPAPPLVGLDVALSLSETASAVDPEETTNREGYTRFHVDDVVAHLTLCLIRAGATPVYGGRPQHGYTSFLASLLAAHHQIGAQKPILLKNYFPAHARVENNDDGDSSRYTENYVVDEGIPDKSELGNALRLIRMRQQMAGAYDVCIALGGKVIPTGDNAPPLYAYKGRFPGIVEECWRALEKGKPLYLIGGFGGAAGVVVDALLGRPTEALDEAITRAKHKSFDSLCRDYAADLRLLKGDPMTLDELREKIAKFGELLRTEHPDSSAVLWTNGLSVADNLRLFKSRDMSEIVHLIMKGLYAYRADRRQDDQEKGKVRVRLYHGNLADVPEAGAYIVGVVNGILPHGDVAVLDERLNGAIRERIDRLTVDDGEIVSHRARLSGDWVVLVKLNLDENTSDDAPIEQRLIEFTLKRGLYNIALSPSGVDWERPLEKTAGAILDALDASADTGGVVVTFCETHRGRYEQLEEYIEKRLGKRGYHALPPDPIVSTVTVVDLPLTLQIISRDDTLEITAIRPSDDGKPIAFLHKCKRDETFEKLLAEARGGSSHKPPDFDALGRIGRALAARIFDDKLAEALLEFEDRPWDIVHDPEAGGVPWELLHIPRKSDASLPNISAFRPALKGGLRRRLREQIGRINTNFGFLSVGPIRKILLIVNPQGNNPRYNLPGTEAEASALVAALEKMVPRVRTRVLWRDEATVNAVCKMLADEPWDVLHYAGHASFREDQREKGGLKMRDGTLTAEVLASCKCRVPPLIFLNACESARVRDGEDPPPEDDTDQSYIGLAEALLRGGVRSLIGNFWKVDDSSARRLATVVYEDLTKAAPIGKALLHGRKVLFEAKDPSWANYILYGDAEMRW